MSIALPLLLLLFAAPPARAADLLCEVKVNTRKVSEEKVIVPDGSSAPYAEFQAFRMKVNHRGGNRYELEIYDNDAPSRSYAEASLRSGEDELKWTLWTREILLETSCRMLR